ncbi:ArsR/SmtB family transcription factor [Limimaricola soesokkakensis]|uniref:ArsR/SmtB family transcription factor n=1 Tax=Limimaricola soesokkakensis TaxID=1343159 RepID=UPI00351996FD
MAKLDARLDLHFAALGDPTRRAILSRLARGPASVSELAAPHDMALPSFMGHLKKLEDAGLITTAKEGRVRHCQLAPDAFAPVQDWLGEQRALWNGRLDRFDDYVANLMKDRKR